MTQPPFVTGEIVRVKSGVGVDTVGIVDSVSSSSANGYSCWIRVLSGWHKKRLFKYMEHLESNSEFTDVGL